MWVVDLLMIAIIICFIVDISGFIESVKNLIVNRILGFKKAEVRIKPFDCSLCMNWWTGLIYIFIIGQFNILGVCTVAIISLMSVNITTLLIAINDLVGVIINKLIDYADKV